jgi:hypothetical protein
MNLKNSYPVPYSSPPRPQQWSLLQFSTRRVTPLPFIVLQPTALRHCRRLPSPPRVGLSTRRHRSTQCGRPAAVISVPAMTSTPLSVSVSCQPSPGPVSCDGVAVGPSPTRRCPLPCIGTTAGRSPVCRRPLPEPALSLVAVVGHHITGGGYF